MILANSLATPAIGTIFWTTLIFAMFFILLRKFAWKPILNAVNARDEIIKGSLEAAEKARDEMKKLQADNETILRKAREERENILKDAREIRDKMINEAKGKAVDEAEKLIEKARQGIEREKDKALSEIHIAFPGDSKIKFEKEVLFPLAGLDTSVADRYYKVMELYAKLEYAGDEVARNYIDGKINREEAIQWLQKYAIMTKQRAEQTMRFIDTYRSYVINYNVGQDLVKDYVIRKGGTENNPDLRWEIIERLLSTPQVPSNLK